MFTRRALFKMLAAIGAGSLLPAVGENGMARFSGIGEGLAFDSSAQPRDFGPSLVNRRSKCRASSSGKTYWTIWMLSS